MGGVSGALWGPRSSPCGGGAAARPAVTLGRAAGPQLSREGGGGVTRPQLPWRQAPGDPDKIYGTPGMVGALPFRGSLGRG